MNTFSNLSRIVHDRWVEAVNDPTIPRLKSLAQLAAQVADAIEQAEPESMLAPAMRGVYEAAYQRMLAMMPAGGEA